MEITALTRDLEMRLRRAPGSLAAAMTAFLASAQLALLASQGFLRGAIEARILNCVALTIGEKGLETDINTDIRMSARAGACSVCGSVSQTMRRIPMPISTAGPDERS